MIRVLIISPHRAVRQGLQALCQTASDMEILSETLNFADLTRKEKSPHVALIDGQDIEYGLRNVQRLRQTYASIRVILLVDDFNSRANWAAALAGAAGCVLKADSAPVLLQTLRSFCGHADV